MLEIIYQNSDYLVINKPNNLAVQLNKNYSPSLEEILNSTYPLLASLPRCGIVHRLDRQTTGLLLIAKNSVTFAYLTSLFKERKIKKTYLALAEGILTPETGQIIFYIQKRFSKKKIQMSLDKQQGKLVKVDFQVLERLNNFTFLKILPLTGRTHQIRVALQNIRHPLYNDPLYSSVCSEPNNGQYLHAYSLEFLEKNGKAVYFQAPLPAYFQERLKELASQKWQDYI